MDADTLQAGYDVTSRFVEANTAFSAEERDWLEQMRRRRWAATWLDAPAGQDAAPAAPSPAPPPPPPPGLTLRTVAASATRDDSAAITLRARTHDSYDDSTTIAMDAAEPEGDTATTIPADNAIDGDGVTLPPAKAETRGEAGTYVESRSTLAMDTPVAATSLSFGRGPLAACWSPWKETWDQSSADLRCSDNVSAKGVLANVGISAAGVHNVTITRASTANQNFIGPALCLSQNGSGQVSGYAASLVAGTCTLYRIDADVWTVLTSAAFGAWNAGQGYQLQRNGTTLKVFNNGVNIITHVDATHAPGRCGVVAQDVAEVCATWVYS